jgi:hypothetical protein
MSDLCIDNDNIPGHMPQLVGLIYSAHKTRGAVRKLGKNGSASRY